MKLKPLGKKRAFYRALTLAGLVGSVISFLFGFVSTFWVCFPCLIWGLACLCDIYMSTCADKYDIKGNRCGPDPFIEYEPGDVEFEREKVWQSDTLEINFDVNVTYNNK